LLYKKKALEPAGQTHEPHLELLQQLALRYLPGIFTPESGFGA
jgi:hypothetical protein